MSKRFADSKTYQMKEQEKQFSNESDSQSYVNDSLIHIAFIFILHKIHCTQEDLISVITKRFTESTL